MASFNRGLDNIYSDLSQPPAQEPSSEAPRSLSPPTSARSAPRMALSFPAEHQAWLHSYLPFRPPPTRPHVTLTYATSLDAALAVAPGVQTALSGPETKAMTHFLRSRHDAILVGAGTAVADDPSLNCRLEGVGGYGGRGLQSQPRPVVLDPSGRWARTVARSKVLGLAREGRGRAPWILTSAAVEDRALRETGGQVIVLPAERREGRYCFDWRTLLGELRQKGIESVMIEGGGAVINSLLEPGNADLVDSVIVTIAPTWLGAGGVVVSPGRAAGGASPVARLRDTQWHQLGDDVVLCGYLR